MMNGKSNVMYRATRAEARQGTRMVLLPARIDRMRVLARGVLVTDVSRPARCSCPSHARHDTMLLQHTGVLSHTDGTERHRAGQAGAMPEEAWSSSSDCRLESMR